MEVGVAAAAISCMEGLSGCASVTSDAYSCVRTALNGACPDPTNQVCPAIEGACFGGAFATTLALRFVVKQQVVCY
jgi:hypothetical protein